MKTKNLENKIRPVYAAKSLADSDETRETTLTAEINVFIDLATRMATI